MAAIVTCACLVACGGENDPAGDAEGDASSGVDTDPDESGSSSLTSHATSAGDASTSGASTGGSSASSGVMPDLGEIEEACRLDCEASLGSGCHTPPAEDQEACEFRCVSVTNFLERFCLEEYADLLSCRSSGGFDCTDGFPVPNNDCSAPILAYSQCVETVPCSRYCESLVACNGGDFEQCRQECDAELAASTCMSTLVQVRTCIDTWGTCVGSTVVGGEPCKPDLFDYAECLAQERGEPCEGYCLLEEQLQCGDACAACQAGAAEPCGQELVTLVECQIDRGVNATQCVDGRLAGVGSCEDEEEAYQACAG